MHAQVKGLDPDFLKITHIQVNKAQKQRRRTFRAHGRINGKCLRKPTAPSESPCHPVMRSRLSDFCRCGPTVETSVGLESVATERMLLLRCPRSAARLSFLIRRLALQPTPRAER